MDSFDLQGWKHFGATNCDGVKMCHTCDKIFCHRCRSLIELRFIARRKGRATRRVRLLLRRLQSDAGVW